MTNTKLLYIADSKDHIQQLRPLLTKMGHFKATTSDNWDKARHYAVNNPIDYILVDKQAQTQLNQQLSDIAQQQQIPVLCISNFLGLQGLSSTSHRDSNGERIQDNILYLKDNHVYHKMAIDKILWIQSNGNYSTIMTDGKKYVLKRSSVSIERLLPKDSFVRIHRNCIVHREHIEQIDLSNNLIKVGRERLNVSRKYKGLLLEGVREKAI